MDYHNRGIQDFIRVIFTHDQSCEISNNGYDYYTTANIS